MESGAGEAAPCSGLRAAPAHQACTAFPAVSCSMPGIAGGVGGGSAHKQADICLTLSDCGSGHRTGGNFKAVL